MHPTESLLGRVSLIEVGGFTIEELGADAGMLNRLWLRGAFPDSYLSGNDETSWTWRSDALNRFIYTDLPQLGVHVPAPMMTRFWQFLAHYHGQTWNGTELPRSLGIGMKKLFAKLDAGTRKQLVSRARILGLLADA